MRQTPFPQRFCKCFEMEYGTLNKFNLRECKEWHEWLYYWGKPFLSDHALLCLHISQQDHDTAESGHLGQAKTFEIVTWEIIWFGMRKDIARYIFNCHTYQWSWTLQQQLAGVLRSLSLLSKPWANISMDFITGLALLEGNDTIWLVVDQLTKIPPLVPCQTTTSASNLADMFV
jgi:hypothetical protein